MALATDRERVAPAIQAGGERAGFRPDIQALRALAVSSVVLYHLWPNRLPGGYVGVDVFFVISGFLITSHLLGEVERKGRLSPARFWARRAKRLMPASGLTLLATSAGILLFAPRLLWRHFFAEVLASALLVQNWRLAHDSVDYLARGNAASPVQHMWTLSVEEQFYVALPVLLLAVLAVTRRRHLDFRTVAFRVLLVVVTASLAWSVRQTVSTPGIAYFSTATRAWEFGAGGLLAFATQRTAAARHRADAGGSRHLAWLGVAAVVTACFAYGSTTAFPGYAAALPVLGTVVAIHAGRRSSWERMGRLAPVAMLGRTSYAAYLWHWPLVILLPYATGRPPGTADKLAIIATTVTLAWASTTFVEDPIRFTPALLGGRRPRTVAVWCGSLTAVIVAIATMVTVVQAREERRLIAQAGTIAAGEERCLGAQAMDPALSPCDNPALAGILVPDPAIARGDDANELPCWGQRAGGVPAVCTLGPATGARKRLLAIGDSHNNQLIGIYRYIAERNGWQIDVAGNAGCYYTTADQDLATANQRGGCASWRRHIVEDVAKRGYDAIIVTHSARDNKVLPPPGVSQAEATVRGLVTAWNALPDVPILAIRDNPAMAKDTQECVAAHRDTAATDCAVPRRVAFTHFDGSAEAVEQVPRARLVDMTAFYCTEVCPPVIGNVLVYRDHSHLTKTYARTLAPYVDKEVLRALSTP